MPEQNNRHIWPWFYINLINYVMTLKPMCLIMVYNATQRGLNSKICWVNNYINTNSINYVFLNSRYRNCENQSHKATPKGETFRRLHRTWMRVLLISMNTQHALINICMILFFQQTFENWFNQLSTLHDRRCILALLACPSKPILTIELAWLVNRSRLVALCLLFSCHS